jgi:hypothetical protein
MKDAGCCGRDSWFRVVEVKKLRRRVSSSLNPCPCVLKVKKIRSGVVKKMK